VNAKKARTVFGTGLIATALALPTVGLGVLGSRTNASLDVCSVEDGRTAEPRADAAAVRFRSASLSPAPAETCPQEPAVALPSPAAAEDTPLIAAPDIERPATVQNLRRADGR
jgi:hypothetical protein